jgi:hypothetical protein
MTWIIIGLILLAAFGPVLWLVPSKRDRHLTALRDQARREGLVVELRRVPKLNPSPAERVSAGGRIKQPVVECTAYIQTLKRRLAVLPTWRLLRDDGADNSAARAAPGWAFDPDFKPDLSQVGVSFQASQKTLAHLFGAIPNDVIGVELSARALTLYWLEGPAARRSTVTEMAVLLASAQDDLVAMDEQLQTLSDDEDS